MRSTLRFLALGVLVATLSSSQVGRAADAPPRAASERLENSRATVEGIRASLSRAMVLLEAARESRDVAKVNFITEKLIALKGMLRIAEQADINLQEALLKHDDAAAAHEEEKLSITLQKGAQFAAEADSYAGDVEIYSGDTLVEVSTPVSVLISMTEHEIFNAVPAIGTTAIRPPAASPYQ